MRVLIVEDDEHTGRYLSSGLGEVGYVSRHVTSAEHALLELRTSGYDVAIVDIMLPQMDGLSLIATMRDRGDFTPVIILSAKQDVDERVEGLRAGGDDYITKPFSFSELLARIQALLRRTAAHGYSTKLQVSDLVMDMSSRSVTRGGRVVDLQPQEFTVLEFLMRNAGRVLPKTVILEHAWDFHFDPQTNVLDVLMCRLRKKVEKNGRKLIHTVRGVGYVLKEDA